VASRVSEVFDALYPVLAISGIELVDVEVGPGLVRVTVDRPGGIDLDSLAEVNALVSGLLDDLDPLPGRYTLEVSSPGLERRLRTPAHFAAAVGQTVSVRTLPGSGEVRRVQGLLASADATCFELQGDEIPGGSLRVGYEDVERARTVFVWGPAPRPTGRKRQGSGARTGERTNDTSERVTTR